MANPRYTESPVRPSHARSRADYIKSRLGCDRYWNGQEYVLSGPGWCLYVRDHEPDAPNCEQIPIRTLLAIKKANRLWPNQSGGYRRLTYLSLENERRLEAAQCSR